MYATLTVHSEPDFEPGNYVITLVGVAKEKAQFGGTIVITFELDTESRHFRKHFNVSVNKSSTRQTFYRCLCGESVEGEQIECGDGLLAADAVLISAMRH